MKKTQGKHFWESLIATVIIMLLVGLLNLINFRVEFTKPIKQGLFDFDVYDLQFSGIPKTNTNRDTNIVLVQAGPDRNTIAGQLLMLDSLEPAVIGVDVLFPDKSSELVDYRFVRMLEQLHSKPVFSFRFDTDKKDNKIPVRNFFSGPGSIHPEGYLDFVGDSLSAVRLYVPSMLLNGDSYTSFTSMILQQAAPEKYSKLQKREHRQELINFSGNLERYAFFRQTDLDYFQKEGQLKPKIKGKIVLLGYFKSENPLVLEDLHFTPMNERVNGRSHPDAYGVIIHANIISMVLAESYLSQSPLWVSYLIASVLVFFMTWLLSRIHHRFHHPLFHLVLLLWLLLLMIIVTGFFVMFFAWFGIKIPLLPIIIGLVISIELFEVCSWLALRFISLFPKKK